MYINLGVNVNSIWISAFVNHKLWPFTTCFGIISGSLNVDVRNIFHFYTSNASGRKQQNLPRDTSNYWCHVNCNSIFLMLEKCFIRRYKVYCILLDLKYWYFGIWVTYNIFKYGTCTYSIWNTYLGTYVIACMLFLPQRFWWEPKPNYGFVRGRFEILFLLYYIINVYCLILTINSIYLSINLL